MDSTPQGKKVEVEPLFPRSLEIIQGTMGPRQPNRASPPRNLGILYPTPGKFVQSLNPFPRQTFAINPASLEPDHPEVAVNWRILAGFSASKGNHPETEHLARKSLGIQEKVLGPEHVEVAASLEGFVALLRTTHRDEAAKELEVRARKIRAKEA